MNPIFGWTLALVGVVAGTALYGWQGLVLALTIVAFWLVLQFGQVMRVMRSASSAPVGHVGSAVMLHAKLHRGMRMLDVVKLTRSLGRAADRSAGDGRADDGPADDRAEEGDIYAWDDAAGNRVIARFSGGRLRSWDLERSPTSAG